jgi:hypothetical protein
MHQTDSLSIFWVGSEKKIKNRKIILFACFFIKKSEKKMKKKMKKSFKKIKKNQ